MGPAFTSSRPSGNLTVAQIPPTSWSSTTTLDNFTAPYYILGDSDTVFAVIDAKFVANCSIVNSSSTAITFDPTVNTTLPKLEQVVQYYGASSFSLSLESYNDTASSAQALCKP
jgi:hypothetical protein